MAIPQGLRQQLWAHQIKALNFATPLLRDPASHQKVALLRLPTGTGKTGIVAALAVVDAPVNWTLVLTPLERLLATKGCVILAGDSVIHLENILSVINVLLTDSIMPAR